MAVRRWRKMEGFLRRIAVILPLYTLSILVEAHTGGVTAFHARFRQNSCRMTGSTLLTVTRQH